MNIEDALIARIIKDLGDGKVEITETWDLNHPDCPIVIWSGLQLSVDENARTAVIKSLDKPITYEIINR